ncbi:MAG: restriction endonuclease subunit S, partial [Bacillota bacterium]|nr:restriction endonuclease subunit S [Bacillota bacterium]
MRLSDREWKIFIIGDLFSIKRPIARNKDHYENGNVPFVASGSGNNGVMKCCKPHKNEELDNAGCITVSPVDGSAFYQPYNFLGRGGAGSSILMLYADNINLYNGQFIAK